MSCLKRSRLSMIAAVIEQELFVFARPVLRAVLVQSRIPKLPTVANRVPQALPVLQNRAERFAKAFPSKILLGCLATLPCGILSVGAKSNHGQTLRCDAKERRGQGDQEGFSHGDGTAAPWNEGIVALPAQALCPCCGPLPSLRYASPYRRRLQANFLVPVLLWIR